MKAVLILSAILILLSAAPTRGESPYYWPHASPKSSGCGWVAWLESCHGGGTLVVRHSLDDFKKAMSDQGDKGRHLTAVDYGAGTWVGFFRDLPGGWRWVTRSKWQDFKKELNRLIIDDYDAEAMAYGDGVYLGWFRENKGKKSSWASRTSSSKFHTQLDEKLHEGKHMTSGLSNGKGEWAGWWVEKGGSSRWAHVYSFGELVDELTHGKDSGYYVTSMVHGNGDWIVWWEEEKRGWSGWARRGSRKDLSDWIYENHDGRCVTAIAYGCD
eukprot:evm.model.scf_1124.2 EVM.evm.TU.scf_1124.2   scf_1124:17760-19653(+)